MTSIIFKAPAAFSASLQDIARNYLAAQQRSGEALLEAAGWLARARAEAEHGQWGIFLEATRTSEGTAKRLLDIHALAQTDPQFAEAVRANWLAATAAAELAQPSTPPAVRQRLLSQDEAPTRAEVQRAKSATVAEMEETTEPSWPGVPTLPPAPWDTESPPPRALQSQNGASDTKPGVFFWGQIPGALESHQWRWVAPNRWESRCEKLTNHEPGPGAGRRCLDCANGAPAVRCDEPGCEEDSIGSQNLCGIRQPRCLRHTEEARAQQQHDEEVAELRWAGERAEKCGATVDYLSRDARGRVKVIPPKGYQQAELRCNAGELADLCVAWEGHARGGKNEQETAGGINWHKVDTLTLNLSTARDVGRALDRWIALGQELLPASPDPRADAARLLGLLGPIVTSYQTERLELLSQAICDLNECREGTEGRHWLAVGAALLDLESEGL